MCVGGGRREVCTDHNIIRDIAFLNIKWGFYSVHTTTDLKFPYDS